MTQYRGGFQIDDTGILQVSTDTPPAGAIRLGKWAVQSDGTAYVETTASVPSSAHFDGGFAYSAGGALYVTTDSVSAAHYIGGIAVRSDGAVFATTDSPTETRYGFGTTSTGQISMNGLSSIAFTVLDTDGNDFAVALDVLDSDGNSFNVDSSVLDSDGNSFAVI